MKKIIITITMSTLINLVISNTQAAYDIKIPLELSNGGRLPNNSIIIRNQVIPPSNPPSSNSNCVGDNYDNYWYEEPANEYMVVYYNGKEVPAQDPITRGELLGSGPEGGGWYAYEVCVQTIQDGTENLPEGDTEGLNQVIYKGVINIGNRYAWGSTYYGYNPPIIGSILPKTDFIENPNDSNKQISYIEWYENQYSNFYMDMTAGYKYEIKEVHIAGIKYIPEADCENYNLYHFRNITIRPPVSGSWPIVIKANIREDFNPEEYSGVCNP